MYIFEFKYLVCKWCPLPLFYNSVFVFFYVTKKPYSTPVKKSSSFIVKCQEELMSYLVLTKLFAVKKTIT